MQERSTSEQISKVNETTGYLVSKAHVKFRNTIFIDKDNGVFCSYLSEVAFFSNRRMARNRRFKEISPVEKVLETWKLSNNEGKIRVF